MDEKTLRSKAMQSRLDRLKIEMEKQKTLDDRSKIETLYKSQERRLLRQEIKKNIRKLLKSKSRWKFFKKVWGKKPKSVYELTGHADKNIRSYISRLNKKITGLGKIKGCRDIGKPKYYRFVCPLLDKKDKV